MPANALPAGANRCANTGFPRVIAVHQEEDEARIMDVADRIDVEGHEPDKGQSEELQRPGKTALFVGKKKGGRSH